MIEIEFEEPGILKCSCCGNETVRLTRFVHQNGDAFAVYYAVFTRGDHDKVVTGIIGLGEWGAGSVSKNRLAFPFRIWTKGEHFQVGLMDREESPYKDVEKLGRILDREEALSHPWKKDVFHITDHIVMDDKIVVDFFQG